MLTLVLKKTKRFDRTIRVRNLTECVTAGVLAPLFALAAWLAANMWIRTGYAVVAGSCVWILFYLLRYGGDTRGPAPDQRLNVFEQELLKKYEHQIRLLKSVKYWYLLPLYVGLLLVDAGRISEHVAHGQAIWADFIAPVIYTAVFAAIWWLNESYGVRRLREQRTQLLALLGEQGICS